MDERIKDFPIREMIEQAMLARKKAYAPYSGFQVGAALLTRDLRIFAGCNVENAAYGSTICAERCAMVKAVSEGNLKWKGIVVLGGKEDEAISTYAYPCGSCLQVMQEFVTPSNFFVIIAKGIDDYKVLSLEELLPYGFGGENLK